MDMTCSKNVTWVIHICVLYMCIYTYIHVCIYAHMCWHKHKRIHMIQQNAHELSIQVHICIYVCIYVYTHICIYTHVYLHKHKRMHMTQQNAHELSIETVNSNPEIFPGFFLRFFSTISQCQRAKKNSQDSKTKISIFSCIAKASLMLNWLWVRAMVLTFENLCEIHCVWGLWCLSVCKRICMKLTVCKRYGDCRGRGVCWIV